MTRRVTRTEALAAKALAEAPATDEASKLIRGILSDVPALVDSLEEAQRLLGNLLPMVDPRYYDHGATMLADAKRCNADYYGQGGS